MSRPKPDPLSADAFRGFYTDILDYRDRAKVEQPRAFLFQMARNLLRDHWRKQKVRHTVHSDQADMDAEPATDEQNDPMAAVQRLQRLEQLKEVLAELSPRRREALMLHRFEGLSQAQIAERMGISTSMVEKHIAFALLHCKRRLQHEPGTEQPE
jgi:RNA polymerase sigma-70 factor (ECF subfamily)